jgi:beta-mannosidase
MLKQSLNGAWQFRQVNTDEWLPANVPGGVHTDLLAAGRIPDPFVGDNELRVQWVAEADWCYQRSFQVGADLLANERVELVCEGLDTLAEVRLNGSLLGAAENAFRAYRWDVKKLLKPGENELVLDFASPVRYCAARNQERAMDMTNEALTGAPHLRKSPSHFGWDWGPKLPAIGIWRGIGLEAGSRARLSDVHARQHHTDGRVSLSVEVQADSWGQSGLSVVATLSAPDGTQAFVKTSLSDGQAHLEIQVEAPQLWWPNGYGAQPLYWLDVSLSAGEIELDRQHFQLGLRTLALNQEPDEWGRSFNFIVNGVPIFARGANWIPSDTFPTRITTAQLEHLISSAALANQNMLRCWGGGYYEDEAFFDLCDRYGILVWQDFMFACAIYPLDDPDFVENVRQEVFYNARRLRQRACLALWCGNNEIEANWVSWGWAQTQPAELKAADMRFFYKTLSEWLQQLDPDHAYWPSSPSSGLPHEIPDSEATGDQHLWEVWHGNKPFKTFRRQFPRFASEFGFQSLPALQTVAAYAQPADWNMTSYIMEHHQRNRAGNGKIIAYLSDHYQLPKDFETLVYLTQILQAEAIRSAVEHWRRSRERCGGTLYWQLNDCWPVASWSSLDYFGRWKALHYAARRFYNPLLLSIEDEGTTMGLFITNDGVETEQTEVRWTLETLSGQVLKAGEQAVTCAPLATTPVMSSDFSELVRPQNARNVVFVAELWQNGAILTSSLATFAPNKHLALADPQLEISVSQTGSELSIRLRGASLARFVELSLAGADVIFSDNYFDLPAGREVKITCPLPEGWDLAKARESIQLRTMI